MTGNGQVRRGRPGAAALFSAALAFAGAAPADAQQAAAKPKAKPTLGFDSNSKDPVSVNADQLRVFVRENKAVYTGNVVATRGDSTLRCTVLTVFYEGGPTAAAATTPASTGGAAAATPGAGTSVKRMECAGPMQMVSKDQTATGDNGTFDNVANKVVMTGNVVLAQGQNVTRGDRLDYDTQTGVAFVSGKPGARVGGVFVQGSQAPEAPKPKRP